MQVRLCDYEERVAPQIANTLVVSPLLFKGGAVHIKSCLSLSSFSHLILVQYIFC